MRKVTIPLFATVLFHFHERGSKCHARGTHWWFPESVELAWHKSFWPRVHARRDLGNLGADTCRRGFAARRLRLPSSPAQTPGLIVGDVIICAVLAVLSAVLVRAPTRKAGRPAAGAQIITN